MQELNLKPIVGLVHHGSGPRYTNLLDPLFPQRLSEYARGVAERYPHIDAYTPVNEPVTTARFSGLTVSGIRIAETTAALYVQLVNQMSATVLAMQEIRKVNPNAKLIQTDDLGYTTTPGHLQYQADFENARRWLSFDLLTGA